MVAGVLAACIGSVLCLPSGIVEIDVARDLTEARAILDGEPWPRHGPEIGGRFHLSPWWFYLAALVLALTSSLTGYMIVMGGLASLKFVLAAWVGWKLGGVRLALATVSAAALPGVAGYQFFGVTHTNFVEPFVWLALALLLSLTGRRVGTRRARVAVLASAVALSLALHAHPTAIALVPSWIALLIVRSGSLAGALRLLPWAVVGGLAPLLPAIPELVSALGAVSGSTESRPYARQVGDSAWSFLALLRGILWAEPASIAGTAFAAGERPPLAWSIAWCALVGTGLVSALYQAVRGDPRARALARWAWLSLLLASVVVAQTVRATPFYATYVVLVPLALVVALGWVGIANGAARGTRALPSSSRRWNSSRSGRTGSALLTMFVAGGLAMQWTTAVSLAQSVDNGWVRLRLPEAGGVKARERSMRESIYLTVGDRDRLARHVCASIGGAIVLHGPLATAADASNGHEFRAAGGRACRDRLRLGAAPADERGDAVVTLPRRLASTLGVTTAAPTAWSTDWVEVPRSRVIAPQSPVPLANARTYPPRRSAWEQGRTAIERYVVSAGAEQVVLVSPLNALHLGWSASAQADGRMLDPLLRHDAFVAWRCSSCTAEGRWDVEVRGLPAGLTQVILLTATIPVPKAAASATPLRQ